MTAKNSDSYLTVILPRYLLIFRNVLSDPGTYVYGEPTREKKRRREKEKKDEEGKKRKREKEKRERERERERKKRRREEGKEE